METYVLLDENNVVINTAAFYPSNATDDMIEAVQIANNAAHVLLLGTDNPINSVQNIQNPYGMPNPGYEFDGIDTFRPPKPGDNYILDIYNINWVEVPQ